MKPFRLGSDIDVEVWLKDAKLGSRTVTQIEAEKPEKLFVDGHKVHFLIYPIEIEKEYSSVASNPVKAISEQETLRKREIDEILKGPDNYYLYRVPTWAIRWFEVFKGRYPTPEELLEFWEFLKNLEDEGLITRHSGALTSLTLTAKERKIDEEAIRLGSKKYGLYDASLYVRYPMLQLKSREAYDKIKMYLKT